MTINIKEVKRHSPVLGEGTRMHCANWGRDGFGNVVVIDYGYCSLQLRGSKRKIGYRFGY